MLVQLQISRKIAQSRFPSVLKTTHKKTFYDISHTTIGIDFGRDISKRGEFLQLLIRTRSNISSILFHNRENNSPQIFWGIRWIILVSHLSFISRINDNLPDVSNERNNHQSQNKKEL